MIVKASNFATFTAQGWGPRRATGAMLLRDLCVGQSRNGRWKSPVNATNSGMRSVSLNMTMFLGCLLLGPLDIPAQTSILTVPREAANSFGDVGGGFLYTYSRVQQVYASSEFDDSRSDLISITGVAFRPDNLSTAPSLDIFVPDLTLRMGVLHGSISDIPPRDFAITDSVMVFNGQNLQFTAPAGLGFGVKITFNTPFLYDRREGQLTLDVFQSGSQIRRGGFDAQRIAEGRGLYSWLAGPDVTQGHYLFVTQFSYVSVPEPAVVWLLALSGLCCVWRRPNA